MGKFNLINSELNNEFTFANEKVSVDGSFTMDAKTNEFKSINCTVYALNADGKQGSYIGNFNGHLSDGEILYTLSEMSRSKSNLVWSAIDEIETYILPVVE